jgi:multicomponent Na+:H+ antiporter subunit A
MIASVFACFLVALLAPSIHRVAGRRAGLVLAMLPGSIFVYLLTKVGSIADGEAVRSSVRWAPTLDVNLSFYLDGLSLLFGLIITGIGALIFIYGAAYMHGKARVGRFHAFLLVFMGAMLGLVLADNIITLFFFWELTSVSSFMLIGFESEKATSRRAALQALLITAGGGLALLGGFILMAIAGGSWEISTLTASDQVRDSNLYLPVLLLVAAGAFTKSAQFPFYFWLPNAMAAPTPVSAYLHSATMVKAGVYLLARLNPVLGDTDEWFALLGIAGGITMLLGAWLAIWQSDLKRILAFSTVSALGTLVLLIGVSEPAAIKAAMVFLLGHALYKGALFMVAGTIDHETGTRDIAQLGGLKKLMPFTAIAAGLAALSMAGIPPLLGFLGKEAIYAFATETTSFAAMLSLVALAGGVLTVIAAAMLTLRPFFGRLRGPSAHAHEAPAAMWAAPILLAVLGVLTGLASELPSEYLFAPAASAVMAQPVVVEIEIWPGFGTVVVLSALTLIVGFAAYFGLEYARERGFRPPAVPAISDRLYDGALTGFNAMARKHTEIVQSGYLRSYVLMILVAGAAVVALPFFIRGVVSGPPSFEGARIYEIGAVVLVALAALVAATAHSRLAAVASLGVVGFGTALIYALFGAPDLAMTQILIETLTVLLFVFVFYHLPVMGERSAALGRLRDASIAVAAGTFMTLLMWPVLAGTRGDTLTQYYLETAQPVAHGRNVVNTILVDFRSLDTLGEIVVLAVAAIGVVALLRLRGPQDPGS